MVDAAGVLAWRIRGGLEALDHEAERAIARGCATHRPSARANLVAFTLWHAAAVVDWTITTLVRGRPELRLDDRWRGTGIDVPIVPIGMPLREADAIARAVDLAALRRYVAVLGATVGRWTEQLSPDELDARPEARAHLAASPLRRPEGLAAQTDWMLDAPVRDVLGRPALAHTFFHAGEAAAAIDAFDHARG